MTSGAPSEGLQRFVGEIPYVRGAILSVVRAFAESLPPGSRVVDVGAGDAPYRELFAHCEYTTVDWENSVHPGAQQSNVISSADDIALDDACADAVVLTEVLEHVAEPLSVLTELHRLLRPGGTVLVTTPFVWELHEMPYDFWRYTPPSLQRLLDAAGFVDVVVEARNDCFSTAAQVLRNLSGVMGRAGDESDAQRNAVVAECNLLAEDIAKLAPLDVAWILPLGYAATARKPGAPAVDGARSALPADLRALPPVDTAPIVTRLRERTERLRDIAVAARLWVDPQQLAEAQAARADAERRAGDLAAESAQRQARVEALEAELGRCGEEVSRLQAHVGVVEARLHRILGHPAVRTAKMVLRVPGLRRLAGLSRR